MQKAIESTPALVCEVMHQPVFTVGPGARVDEVMALARREGVHHFPIVQHGKLLGLVCTCDLADARPDLRAIQLARRQVVTALPDSRVTEAARLMGEHAVGSVVIANRDGVWGIVTREDLAQIGDESAALLADAACSACGTTRHLRPGPNGSMLCVKCEERANASAWFDEGGNG
jgi:predicted transcriptional regulator